jgi:hypothetical protein
LIALPKGGRPFRGRDDPTISAKLFLRARQSASNSREACLAAVVFLAPNLATQRSDFSSVRLEMPPVGEVDGERDCPGDPARRADGADTRHTPCHDEYDGAREAERKGIK